MKNLGPIVLTIGLLVMSVAAVAQDPRDGADAYKLCASCHGFKGEGNALVNAPSLAGQESWYLERQIHNFRDGIRGGSADDAHGQTMALMTRALNGDDDVADIVAYIGTLPRPDAAVTIDGNVEQGRTHYVPCAACHGQNGEGNAALNSPALAHMDDWYQVAQLEKFRDGRRGTAAGDVYGMQMVPMAQALPDDSALRDVVAYINSLR